MRREALVRLAERGLGVEPRVARRGHDVEEQLTEEVLIVDVEREVQTRRLELHPRGSLEHPLRGEERRKLARDENVRMPANELFVQASRDLARVERSLLARELRVQGDLQQKVAKLVSEASRIARVERGEGLVRLLEKVRTQRFMGLLAIPRAAVRCSEPLDDARQGAKRREIRERLERREHEKATGSAVLGFGQRGLAVRIEERDRVSDGVTRAQKLPVDGTIERDGDGAQRRKRVPIEAARRNDVDAGGPALQDGSQRRRATRTRGQG